MEERKRKKESVLIKITLLRHFLPFSLGAFRLPCGWFGEAKVLCILQLILAYSWARLAILAAGGGRGGMFLLLFLHTHPFSSFSPVPLFNLLYYLFYMYLSSPFLLETTQNDTQRLTWY